MTEGKPHHERPIAFHVMAKPTGARCNMDCAYCFFLKKEGLYPGSNFRMTGLHFWSRGYCVSTVGLDEATIRKYIQEQDKLESGQGDLGLT